MPAKNIVITNTQKMLLSEDTQALVEAGFLTPDLKITDSLRYYLEHLLLKENFEAVVKRAKEKLAEAENQNS